jgi:hypothetical protein
MPPAQAVLGEPMTGFATQVDATTKQRLGLQVEVQTQVTRRPDGSAIHEYALPGGRVFAVSWHTRGKPRLDELLGKLFPDYAQAARQAMRLKPGAHHSAHLEQGDLVIDVTAVGDAHVGRAWLKSLLPRGLTSDALR